MKTLDLSKRVYAALPRSPRIYLSIFSSNKDVLDQAMAEPEKQEMHAPLTLLLKQLQLARPRWSFFIDLHFSRGKHNMVYIFQDTDECLGWVKYGSYDEEYQYDCRTLRERRQRNEYNRSTKIEKTRSDILKHFAPMTLSQKMKALKSAATSVLHDMYQKRVSNFSQLLDTNLRNHRLALLNKWDEVGAIIGSDDDANISMAALKEEVGLHKAAEKNYDDWLRDNYAMAIIGPHIWTIQRGDQISEVVHTQVPDKLRTAVGMLKLVDVGGNVPGYGLRVAENQFLLFGKE